MLARAEFGASELYCRNHSPLLGTSSAGHIILVSYTVFSNLFLEESSS